MDLREQPGAARRHPWEIVRAEFFVRLLAGALPQRPVRIVDVGAGDGYVAGQLAAVLPQGSSIACIDAGYTDDQLAVLRLEAPPDVEYARTVARGELADALVLLDVVEHVADDAGFLRAHVGAVRGGGLVLISVPAHPSLYTQHDVGLGHHRRYTPASLHTLARGAGLRVRRSGSLFGSLLVPRALGKLVERVRGIRSVPPTELAPAVSTGLSRWSHGPLVTGAIAGVLATDARACALASRWALPSAGLSTWMLCERVGATA